MRNSVSKFPRSTRFLLLDAIICRRVYPRSTGDVFPDVEIIICRSWEALGNSYAWLLKNCFQTLSWFFILFSTCAALISVNQMGPTLLKTPSSSFIISSLEHSIFLGYWRVILYPSHKSGSVMVSALLLYLTTTWFLSVQNRVWYPSIYFFFLQLTKSHLNLNQTSYKNRILQYIDF